MYSGFCLRFLIFSAGLCVFGISQSGCMRRSFNKVSHSREVYTPLTATEFEEGLFSGAREALNFFSQDELVVFFDESTVEELKASRKSSFISGLAFQFPLPWALLRSAVTPVWISRTGSGSIPDGGLVMLNRDLFPEGYYRLRSGTVPLKVLMTQMPWFEWDDGQKTYRPRRGGASERILKGLFALRGAGDSFVLYRGGGLRLNVVEPAMRNPYVSGRPESSEVMFFSSPSLNTALAWANPAVWKIDLLRAELLNSVRNAEPDVYVGFEYHYPEIAFLRTKLSVALPLRPQKSSLLCVNRRKLSSARDVSQPADAALSTSQDCNPKWLSAHLSGFPEAAVELKKALLKTDALLKMVAVRQDSLQEGNITCALKAGTEIEFSQAFEVQNRQLWIHSSGIDAGWGCPRSFSTTHFYIDAEKVSAVISK